MQAFTLLLLHSDSSWKHIFFNTVEKLPALLWNFCYSGIAARVVTYLPTYLALTDDNDDEESCDDVADVRHSRHHCELQ